MFRPSERLKGMGIGCLFLALFGAVWMLVALNTMSALWIVACVLVPGSLLVLRAIGLLRDSRRVRATEPPPTPEEAARARDLGRRFSLIFMIEFGLIAAAANLLSHFGRLDWIVPAVGIIVGAHFLPLARVFDYPVYNWTGGVEVVLCATLGVATQGHPNATDALVGLIMGLSLWITVLVELVQAHWLAARALERAAEARSNGPA